LPAKSWKQQINEAFADADQGNAVRTSLIHAPDLAGC